MIEISNFGKPQWTFLARTVRTNLEYIADHCYAYLDAAENSLAKAKTLPSKFHYSEVISFLDILMEKISMADIEAQLMINLSKYVVLIETENVKMKLISKYIHKENLWLRMEVLKFEKSLKKIEYELSLAESEKKYFQYYYIMRNDSNMILKFKTTGADISLQEEDDNEPEEYIPENMCSLFSLVKEFISESNHKVAISLCKKSLVEYRKLKGKISAEVGMIYCLLGRVYKNDGCYTIAQECFETSLTIREKVHGKTSDQVAITSILLSSVLGKRELYAEAIAVSEQALSILELSKQKYHLEIQKLCIRLAVYSLQLKSWNDAIKYYNIALDNLNKIYESKEMIMIRAFTNLARAYVEIGVYNKAKIFINKVNESYVKRNFPQYSTLMSPVRFIEYCVKGNIYEFQAEILMEQFGSVSNILDDNIIEVMIMYYGKVNQPKTVELLNDWVHISL